MLLVHQPQGLAMLQAVVGLVSLARGREALKAEPKRGDLYQADRRSGWLRLLVGALLGKDGRFIGAEGAEDAARRAECYSDSSAWRPASCS